jgi:hypothetical protein
MPTYYFNKTKTSIRRYGGTNYLFKVWKQTKKGLKALGTFKINTASYRGDRGEVARFVAKKEGYRMTDSGYRIKRKDVHIKYL